MGAADVAGRLGVSGEGIVGNGVGLGAVPPLQLASATASAKTAG
ncbi:MAG: hypothetical protein ACXVQJ_00645 [Actinomycetota bacterium]